MAPTLAITVAVLLFALLGLCAHSVCAINCYQCDSNVDLECSEEFDHDVNSLRSRPCDFIHEARFCIKTTGMYGGRIGTIRNCSSRDLGDYCTYIDRTGDIRHTRSCVYTCSSSDCNRAHATGPATLSVIATLIAALTIYWITVRH